MTIIYERTMEIEYNDGKMEETMFRKLVGELSTKNMYVCGRNDEYSDNKFGFVEIESYSRHWTVTSPEHGEIMTTVYQSDADDVVDAFASIIEGIVSEKTTTITKKKEWAEPEGSHVAISNDIGLDGKSANLHEWGNNHLLYDNGSKMTTRVENDYGGLKLIFCITWEVDTIQRKDKIEEAMVETVMTDMGQIQAAFEGRLKLKKFGYDVENVSIDCHFDVKTESRSECTPDIIKQVRDARTKMKVE